MLRDGSGPARRESQCRASPRLIMSVWCCPVGRRSFWTRPTRSTSPRETSFISQRSSTVGSSAIDPARSCTWTGRNGWRAASRLRRLLDRSQRDPPAVTQVRVRARDRHGLCFVRDANNEEPVYVVTPCVPGLHLYPLRRVVQYLRGESKRPPLYTHAARLQAHRPRLVFGLMCGEVTWP